MEDIATKAAGCGHDLRLDRDCALHRLLEWIHAWLSSRTQARSTTVHGCARQMVSGAAPSRARKSRQQWLMSSGCDSSSSSLPSVWATFVGGRAVWCADSERAGDTCSPAELFHRTHHSSLCLIGINPMRERWIRGWLAPEPAEQESWARTQAIGKSARCAKKGSGMQGQPCPIHTAESTRQRVRRAGDVSCHRNGHQSRKGSIRS